MWNQTPPPTKPAVGAQPTSPSHGPLDALAAGIGKSVVIKGDVIGSEDLTIDGRVEGRIELPGHSLLIGPNANVQAQVVARSITIMGAVTGNITASDKVDIRNAGSVDGDIDAPRVAMADGAQLCGRIDTLSATKDHRPPLGGLPEEKMSMVEELEGTDVGAEVHATALAGLVQIPSIAPERRGTTSFPTNS